MRRFYSSGNDRSGDSGHPGMSLSNLVGHMVGSDQAPMGGVGEGNEGEVPGADLPEVDLLLRQIWPEMSPDLPTPDTIRHMAELCE